VALLSFSATFRYSRTLCGNLGHRLCRHSADIKMGDETQRVLKSKTRKKLIAAFLYGYVVELLNGSTLQFFDIYSNSLNSAVEQSHTFTVCGCCLVHYEAQLH
jgi:hypothetical protein